MTNTFTCPICNKANYCNVESAKNENCWCFNEGVPKALIELAKQKKGNPTCICKACIDAYRTLK